MFVLAFISENLAWQKEHSRRGNKTVLNLINFFYLENILSSFGFIHGRYFKRDFGKANPKRIEGL
jgi:hypothetical protein